MRELQKRRRRRSMRVLRRLAVTAMTTVAGLGTACAYASTSGAQCCSSIAPEHPPATTYGATVVRLDDPRSHYQPYQPMPLDATAPPEVLMQRLWMREEQLGAYSRELVPELRNLGASLFADGQYPDAVDTYKRAIHLLRVNEGLNTHAQTGMVEQVIEAHMEMGNYIAADDQHEYLFRIRKANLSPDDPELLAAVEQYADWQRAAYLGQLDRFRFPRIVKLFDLYGEMADALEASKGGLSRAMLPYLEGKLRTEYMLSVYPGEREEGLQFEALQRDSPLKDLTQLRFMAFEKYNYRNGLKSIQTMEDILVQAGDASPRELADTRVRLGDWYQWHRRYALAIRAYEEAWEMMVDQPDGNDWLEATFANPLELPSQVIFQPGRMPLRLFHSADLRARFAVSRHGEARDIEILSPLPEEDQSAVIRGLRYLRDMRFRPCLEDGSVVASGEVERIYSIRF